MSDGRWTTVTPSEFAHERAALDEIRRHLPDVEPWRAWSNLVFYDSNGRPSEVDLVVLAPSGLWHVEVKSWPDGRLRVQPGTWEWQRPDGHVRRYDNPHTKADAKSKRLKSLLQAQKTFRRRRDVQVPFVNTVVHLSSPSLKVEVDRRMLGNVLGPDSRPTKDLPGLVAELERQGTRRPIDRMQAVAVRKAFEEADIRPSEVYFTAGEHRLVEQVDEGPSWTDFHARHKASRVSKRVRVHHVARLAEQDDKRRLMRAVEREHRLLSNLRHSSIESPEALVTHPAGPALVYPWAEDAVRLDHWVAQRDAERATPAADDADELRLRLNLFRRIAEAVDYAHEHGLAHRTLSPQRVWIVDDNGTPVPRLRDWSTAARGAARTATGLETATDAQGTRTVLGVARLMGGAASPYLAPEVRTTPDTSGERVDVFALGCLAYLLVSGRDPADDHDSLLGLLDEHGHVPLASGVDRALPELQELIAFATDPNSDTRLQSVSDVLSWLEPAMEDLAAPAPTLDLTEATKGTTVGRFTIEARIGSGATSVVFLARRDDDVREVLKVARNSDEVFRLQLEEEALRKLHHSAIIATYGTEDLDGHTVLRLEAGQVRAEDDRLRAETLAKRLRDAGPPSLDLVRRWGIDLLDALVVMEREGVQHRDLKPENLVLVERGKDKALHLAVIDFSLTATPTDDLDAGTIGYLDPFLRDRETRRWDLDAERYAAAVVLTELATGRRPIWGDGVDPRHTELDTPSIPSGMDPAIAAPLMAMLTKALHRDPTQRFDTAEALRDAFTKVFARADEAAATRHTTDHPSAATDDPVAGRHRLRAGTAARTVDLDGVTADTPVADLGLDPALASAIERLGAANAGDLAGPLGNRTSLEGVGARTRRDLRQLVADLRAHGLAEAADEQLANLDPADVASLPVDILSRRLVPSSGLPAQERAFLLALLGLPPDGAAEVDDGPSAVALDLDLWPTSPWPTAADAAAAIGLNDSQRVDALLRARRRWQEKRPGLRVVRDALITWLAGVGGVATGEEAAALLLARRGSYVDDPVLRQQRARAVVRAAVEADAELETPRLRAVRDVRGGSRLLLALDAPLAIDPDGPRIDWAADPLAQAAFALADVADDLVADEPVLAPQTVRAAMHDVELPDLPDGVEFSPGRRLSLAAAASEHAAASSRDELYRAGLAPVDALSAVRVGLLDRHGITREQVVERVRARFPRAEALPPRPQLDHVLVDAKVGLTFDDDVGRYVIATAHGGLSTRRSSTSWTTYTEPTQAEIEQDLLDRTLQRLATEGGYVAASVDPRRLDDAVRRTARRLDATVVDLDATLIAAMRDVAARRNAQWPVITNADAENRTSAKWRALQRLVDEARSELDAHLTDAGRLVVAHGVGLLARYGHVDHVLDPLRDRLTRDADLPGRLRGLLVIVPDAHGTDRPRIDGTPIPAVTAAQQARIPSTWLDAA